MTIGDLRYEIFQLQEQNKILMWAYDKLIARTQNQNTTMGNENTKCETITQAFSIEQQIKNNKSQRRDIDDLLQVVKVGHKSRERSLCITKLQEAIMWLGMDLKRIAEESPCASEASGNLNPYPNSKDPSNLIIDKTADGLKL